MTDATIGPVEYLVIHFDGNRFTGDLARALAELVDSGTVRIIDLALVSKDADDTVTILEAQELSPEVAAAFVRLEGAVSGLLSEEDLLAVAESLDPGCAAAALLVEHVWATRFAAAVRAADGSLVLAERIPHAVSPRRGPRSSPPPTPSEGAPRMLGSRRGRPGLIGRTAQTMARTAVVSATATAVSGKVAAARQAAPAATPPQAAPAAPPPADAPGLSDDAIARLRQLAELHASGILTDAEFTEQKARILA